MQSYKRYERWEQLAAAKISASDAAVEIGCSKRTALRELKSAALRVQEKFERDQLATKAALEIIGLSGQISNWPKELIEIAEKIRREGDDCLTSGERRQLIAMLPRGISVANH